MLFKTVVIVGVVEDFLKNAWYRLNEASPSLWQFLSHKDKASYSCFIFEALSDSLRENLMYNWMREEHDIRAIQPT